MKISTTIFLNLEYVQRYVSPFFKAKSVLFKTFLDFPMFQSSTHVLGP